MVRDFFGSTEYEKSFRTVPNPLASCKTLPVRGLAKNLQCGGLFQGS